MKKYRHEVYTLKFNLLKSEFEYIYYQRIREG